MQFAGQFDGVFHLAPTSAEPFVGLAEKVLIASSGAVVHKAASYRDGYAGAKRENEHIASAHVNTVTARIYSVLARNLQRHLAAAQFLTMARAGGPIVVHSGGVSIRSYLYVDDLVAALWAIFTDGDHQPYEVGSDNAITIASLAQRIGLIADVPVFLAGPDGPSDMYLPDTTRLKTLGDFEQTSLDDAIRMSL